MEGQTKPTNKLRFLESKKKIKVDCPLSQHTLKVITAANKHDLTLIGSDDKTVRYLDTKNLLDFNSTQSQIINQSLDILINLTFQPTLLSTARYGYSSIVLICGMTSFPKCLAIEVFDLDTRTTVGKLNSTELGDAEVIDYAWHPSYYDSIVALCTSRGQLLILAINKQDKGIGIVYKNEQYGALTCCWSMKGKNLAVGTQRGQVFRLEPVIANNNFSFKEVAGSNITFENPKITPDHQLMRLRWINQKYLLAVHARLNCPSKPETVHSIITVKPGKPYLYWTNVSFESQTPASYNVHLANLSNTVLCASTATGEAAVIGLLGANEVATNDLNDWSALIIEEEGARVELPLDMNNRETHPLGLTMTTLSQDSRPVLIFCTNDGLLCSYAAMHNDNILKFPEHIHQPEQTFIFDVPKQVASNLSSFGGKATFYQSNLPLSRAPAFGGAPSFFQSSLTQPLMGAFDLSKQQQQQQPQQQQPQPQPTQVGQLQQPQVQQIQQAQPPIIPPSTIHQTQLLPQIQQQAQQTQLQSAQQPSIQQQQQQPRQPSLLPQQQLQSPQSRPQQTLQTQLQSPQQAPLQQLQQLKQSLLQPQSQQQVAQPRLQQTQSPQSQVQLTSSLKPQQQQPPPTSQPAAQQESETQIQTLDLRLLDSTADKISEVKEKLKYNEAYITLFEELIYLRDRFEEVLDFHRAHREALDAVKDDINRLDLEVLETFYLVEYVKSRISCEVKKNTIDPVTLKKVNNIKMKLKHIEGKLDELNDHVDVAWEDFVRRKSNKERRVTSLEMIYKALANNQKIITVLRKKVEIEPEKSQLSNLDKMPTIRPKEDHSNFREFLASRSVVPVRKPIHLKH